MAATPPEPPSGSEKSNVPSRQLHGELDKTPKRERKDFWDKFAAMSTSIVTALVAIVGLLFTVLFNARQDEIPKTQTIAQLMPFLTSENPKTQETAFIVVKVLNDTKLMVELAVADRSSIGGRKALRDVAYHAEDEKDRALALGVLRQLEIVSMCDLPFKKIAAMHLIDELAASCGMLGSATDKAERAQNLAKNNFCAGATLNDDKWTFAYRDMTIKKAGKNRF